MEKVGEGEKLTPYQITKWFYDDDYCNEEMSGAILTTDVSEVLYSELKDVGFNFRERLGIVNCAIYSVGELLYYIDGDLNEGNTDVHAGELDTAFLATLRNTLELQQDACKQRLTDFEADISVVQASVGNWITLLNDVYASNTREVIWHKSRKEPAVPDLKTGKFLTSSVVPPLSTREEKVQCPEDEAKPCHTKWIVGQADCEMNPESVFEKFAQGCKLPTICGPSGHLVLFFNLAKIMRFTEQDLVSFRHAMIAWMVPVRDHSFLEIIATAEPFMPQKNKWPTIQGTFDILLDAASL